MKCTQKVMCVVSLFLAGVLLFANQVSGSWLHALPQKGRKLDRHKQKPLTSSKPAAPSPETRMDGAVGIKFVYIPAGVFQMGSSKQEALEAFRNLKGIYSIALPEWVSNEQPKHRVVITKPFWMGQFEITQAQWESVMGTNPSNFKDCPTCPVENVSWDDSQEFIRKLNAMGGENTYALPTEAEWEYACRAGTTTSFSFGATITPELVNYNGDFPFGNVAKGQFREKTIPVGSLDQPNRWGLHDMHGNVWEWCADWYDANYYGSSPTNDPKGPSSGKYRVLRGGSGNGSANVCRSAFRLSYAPTDRVNYYGFRVVMHFSRK